MCKRNCGGKGCARGGGGGGWEGTAGKRILTANKAD